MTIKYLDMFAGAGGFRTGLKHAGGFFMPVGWCEIDRFAQKAYRALYETDGEYFCEDARQINTDDVPDIDLICAGFPCQPFSVSGRRLGFDDTRGYSITRVGKPSELSSPRYMSWGMVLNGVCLTARISECRNSDGEYTLSDILIADCPEKYFLSPKAMARLLRNLYPDGRGSVSTLPKEQQHV